MQTNLFQRLFTSRTTSASIQPRRIASAPVELHASALKHVAGGDSPNGGWTRAANIGTGSPNGGW